MLTGMADFRIGGTAVRSVTDREQILMLPELIQAGLRIDFQGGHAKDVCLFGIDTASIVGDIVSDMADEFSPAPVNMVCDSRVPGWVSEDTACIVISYADIGEEMARVCSSLSDRGCRVYLVSSSDIGVERVPTVRVPRGLDPRAASGFVLGAVCRMLQSLGTFDAADRLEDELDRFTEFRDALRDRGCGPAPLPEGAVPVTYSTSDIHACSKAWKYAMGMHGKELSFYGELPEFDHNELVGWSDRNAHAPELSMIVMRGDSHKGLVSTIVECMSEVLRENGRDVVPVALGDGTATSRNLRGILLGYCLSIDQEGSE